MSKDIKWSQFDISIGDRNLLKNTDLTIVHGKKYGLIGANGMGKTTLLNSLNSRLYPIDRNIDIFLVEQEIYATDKSVLQCVLDSNLELNKLKKRIIQLDSSIDDDNIEEYNCLVDKLQNYDIDSLKPMAHKILYGLGFELEQQFLPTKQFSGGWRMRISLARALFMQPTLLLLDEPTNHLDLNAVIWLYKYLETWKNTLIIVSHDVDFLDTICTDIIYLHQKKLSQYKGDYSNFKKMFQQIKTKELKDWELLQKKIKEDKKKGNYKESKDTNPNLKEQKNLKKKSKKNLIEESSSEKIENNKIEKPKDYLVTFSFPKTYDISPPILEVKNVSFKYKSTTEYIFKDLDFGINMDDRICIVGTNGVGKSTLLNLIMNELPPTQGEIICNRHLRIGKFNQHFVDKLPSNQTPIEYLLQLFPSEKEQNIRALLGKYGLPGSSHLISMGSLSGGQKARIQLLLVSLSKPHIILMDEPTNHLDMESIEALMEAINNFNGGIIIISHDMRLIENTNCNIWLCDNLNCQPFPGDLEDYKDYILDKCNNPETENIPQSNSIFDFL